MFSFGSKSGSFSLAVAITASLMGANVYSFTEVSGESDSGWIDVLSDPYYGQDIEECNSAGASEWCFKDWNCPTEQDLCHGLANKPGVTIRNSKTLDKFQPSEEPKIAYKAVLQGCSFKLECSSGYSDVLGINIPVSKLLEFSDQHIPEITIAVSNLSLGGLNHGILTDLWFVDEESKVVLVIDVYWQRGSWSLPLPPPIVLEERGYKVYHNWEQPQCLTNNLNQYQSCSLSVGGLLANASSASYYVANCISLTNTDCYTLSFEKAPFDYSKFVLQEIDSGIELLFSPLGETTATITYSQLRYWSQYDEEPSETEITVRTDLESYSDDEEITRPSLQLSSLAVIHPTDGAALKQLEAGEDAVISTTVRNPLTVSQSYTMVTQITDENSITIDIFLEPGIVGAESIVNLRLPWSADSPGAYKIQVMMFDDLESPSILSESSALIIPVS